MLKTPMEIPEILNAFHAENRRFPRAAVESAVARREEIVPELLNVLEKTLEKAERGVGYEGGAPYLYAMLLLAQFRETRAYPLIVRFASLPEEILEDLCSDFVTEDLPAVLASVCGGDPKGIQSLIENPDASEWARGAALDALVALVKAGVASRDEIVLYFARLFRGGLEREYSHVWDALVSAACDIYPGELQVDIKKAYRAELVDPVFISLEDVEADLKLGQEQVLERLAQGREHRLIEDTIQEMSWWACFNEKPERPPNPVGTPAAKPKIGRNDPCLCGSGKKFKKCCGSPAAGTA